MNYFKSEMGQISIQSDNISNFSSKISIWPQEMKLIFRSLEIIHKSNENENEFYSNFINCYLSELDYQLQKSQNELNERKMTFIRFTLGSQQLIESYIEQNVYPLRIEIDHKIELIYYDYHIQVLKQVYKQLRPNLYQVCVFK